MKTGHSAQEVVVSVEALGRLALGALDLGLLQPRRDRTHHARGHLVLQVEHVFENAIEAIRPNVTAGHRIDELPGNAHARSTLAHATFEHIAHPQLATDLLHVNGLALVGERRVSGDYEEPADTREPTGDVLDHAVSEILLLGLPTHVLKRQNGDGWPVRKREVRGIGKIRGPRRSGEGTLWR